VYSFAGCKLSEINGYIRIHHRNDTFLQSTELPRLKRQWNFLSLLSLYPPEGNESRGESICDKRSRNLSRGDSFLADRELPCRPDRACRRAYTAQDSSGIPIAHRAVCRPRAKSRRRAAQRGIYPFPPPARPRGAPISPNRAHGRASDVGSRRRRPDCSANRRDTARMRGRCLISRNDRSEVANRVANLPHCPTLWVSCRPGAEAGEGGEISRRAAWIGQVRRRAL
jgi:hypothetical protein